MTIVTEHNAVYRRPVVYRWAGLRALSAYHGGGFVVKRKTSKKEPTVRSGDIWVCVTGLSSQKDRFDRI